MKKKEKTKVGRLERYDSIFTIRFCECQMQRTRMAELSLFTSRQECLLLI